MSNVLILLIVIWVCCAAVDIRNKTDDCCVGAGVLTILVGLGYFLLKIR